jgi:uncharacterized protein (TIGR02757 family)
MIVRLTRREVAIKTALDAVRARCDVAARRAADPVAFAHRFENVHDRELVALVAACVAFGNVRAIRSKLEDLLVRLGPSPARISEDPEALTTRLRGWRHRVFRGEDIACLLAGARAVQQSDGSLGARFSRELARHRRANVVSEHEVLRLALATWCGAIREAGGLVKGGSRRGPAHLLPDARAGSGSKRLFLFLRWMVRRADGVDLGLWNLDPASLLVPVDVHIHKLARNLGFTERRALSFRTTREITEALARLDPRDPTGYDFSLCHMGMLQRCPSRRDPRRCEGCGVKPVCVHWQGKSSIPAASASGRQSSRR